MSQEDYDASVSEEQADEVGLLWLPAICGNKSMRLHTIFLDVLQHRQDLAEVPNQSKDLDSTGSLFAGHFADAFVSASTIDRAQ